MESAFLRCAHNRITVIVYFYLVFGVLQYMSSRALELVPNSGLSQGNIIASVAMVFLAKASCIAGELVALFDFLQVEEGNECY